VEAAPKASGCIFGGAREIVGLLSVAFGEDFLGGTKKAEDAKLPGAGISPELWPNGKGGNGATVQKCVRGIWKRSHKGEDRVERFSLMQVVEEADENDRHSE